MTTLMSAKKPQMALMALLIILSTLLAACGDSTATTAPQSATTAAAGAATTAAAGAATTAAAGAATTAAAGAAAASGPAVKINVFSPQFPDQDLATNAFSKEISQKFNIQFNWQTTTLDGGPAKEKRQISLASGDYPDLYLLIPWVDQFTQADLLKFSKQGIVLPLNDLIKQYAPNIQATLDKNSNYKAMATAPDGKIYGLPQLVECYHCTYQGKLWMNSDWLKKLNLKQPTTTEEMKAVLTAFKTKDPNGNGKADEIPLSADVRDVLIPYFMNSFIYDPQGTSGNNQSTLVLNNGKVEIQANKDGWKQGLAFIRSLYEAGLIDQGAFTQNADALKKLGDNAGTVILGSATVLHPYIFVTGGSPDGRDKQYDAVPPLKGPTGLAHTGYNFPAAPGATFVLTNKASKEVQVAAIKMLDYIFTTEGEIKGVFGTDERTVVKPGPNDIPLEQGATPLYKQVQRPTGVPAYNTNWSALAQYNNNAAFRAAEAVPTDIYSREGYERRLYDATKLYEGKEDKSLIYPYWGVWIDPALGSEVATLQTNIENYVAQNSLQFITGSKSLDKDWDSYVKGLDQLGLKRYLEIQQQAFDKSSYKK
ncbi:MAG: extracellular solute-binding protein family 1 [Chloroflexi bacterium]|jgi:putative aldouronate transport system substrate-binding protein|nr:extracellular solute-binding protein family 1 [Chloroflexota bacterium]